MPSEERGRSLVRARSTTMLVPDKPQHSSVPPKAPRASSVQSTSQASSRRGSGDLRQAAIRNGLYRSGSGNNVVTPAATIGTPHPGAGINKNIPMVPADTKTARNLGKRWANFSINQNFQKLPKATEPTEQGTQPFSKPSISPLTYVKGSAATSSRTPNTTFLATPVTPTTDNKFDDLHGDEVSDNPLANNDKNATKGFYHRMSLLITQDRKSAHDSMHSLAPMTRFASELDTSEDEDELDESEIDKDQDRDGPLTTTSMDMDHSLSVMDIMKEVNQFQTNLVDRSLPRKENAVSTRTQQKLLDLRDLIAEENDSPSPGLLNLLDYSVKIQHEAVLLEWTQIRLRFSSHVTSKSGTNISCHAGVLGFAQRYKDHVFAHPSLGVTRENVSNYMLEMWESEIVTLTRGSKKAALPTYDEDGDIYKQGNTLMSSLARSVMLSREATPSH